MTNWVRVVATGLVASAVATRVKTTAEQQLQPLGERLFPPAPADKLRLGADPAEHPENMPPSELVDRARHAVTGEDLSAEQRLATSAPLHWVMGVGGGLAYALTAARYPAARRGHGALFGLVLFGATHGSVLPAAGLQAAPTSMPKAWWVWELGSHLAYAVTVDSVIRVVDRLGDQALGRRHRDPCRHR